LCACERERESEDIEGIGLPPAPTKKTRRRSLGPAGPDISSAVMSLRRR